MAAKIVWTNNAEEDLESIKNYLEKNWPDKVLLSFLDRLVSKLKHIEAFPEIGRPSENSYRRRLVITKHNLLIYSIQGEEIVIEAIFDTRQGEQKLNF
jgi:addiction module RelE/StbE family toxin